MPDSHSVWHRIGTCYYSSEGAERERYGNILVDLQFTNVGLDRVDNIVNEICYYDKENKKIESKKVAWTNYLTIIDMVENGEV